VEYRDTETQWRFTCDACQAHIENYVSVCPSCFQTGRIFQRFQRRASLYAPRVEGLTARQLVRTRSKTVTLAVPAGLVLAPGSFTIVTGPPAGGKTTLILKMSDQDCLGPSLVYPLEMGIGPLLSDMCARLELVSEQIRFEEPQSQAEMFALARAPFHAVFIDSLTVSTLRPEDCRRMARGSNLYVVGILQETKAHQPAGSNSWIHACDVLLSVSEMKWQLEKSRYQEVALGGCV